MDPNNGQQQNTQPIQQAVPPPAQPAAVPPMPTSTVPAQTMPPVTPPAPVTAPQPPQASKSGNKKGIILIIILLLLILGMASYLLFAKKQLSKPVDNVSTSVPVVTIEPTATPATIEEVEIASPDADLIEIEKEIEGL